jgi:hypothetical protein
VQASKTQTAVQHPSAPAFVKFLFVTHNTANTAIAAGAVDTAGAFTFLFFNHGFLVANGAPGVTQVTVPTAGIVYTAASKTLVITINSYVYTILFT